MCVYVCACFILQNMICDRGVTLHFKLGYYCMTLAEVRNAQVYSFRASASLTVCVGMYVHVHVCVNTWELCVCETAGTPQFTIYPELIGVWESERNASRPNRQSMTLISQLDADV